MVRTSLELLINRRNLVRIGEDHFKTVSHHRKKVLVAPGSAGQESCISSDKQAAEEELPPRQNYVKRKGTPLRYAGELTDVDTDDDRGNVNMAGSDSNSVASDEMEDPSLPSREQASTIGSASRNEKTSSSSAIVKTANESPKRTFRKTPGAETVRNSTKRKGTSARPQSPELLPPALAAVGSSVHLRAREQSVVTKLMPSTSEKRVAGSSSGLMDVKMKGGLHELENSPLDCGSGHDSGMPPTPRSKSVGQKGVVPLRRASATKSAAMNQPVTSGQEPSPQFVSKDSCQTPVDADEDPAESSSRASFPNVHKRCLKCPFSGYGYSYDRHMRGHENEFALKCEVAGCGWTTEHPPSLAVHTRMHRTAAAAALGTKKSITTELLCEITSGTRGRKSRAPEDDESSTLSEMETVKRRSLTRRNLIRRKGTPLKCADDLTDVDTDDDVKMTGSDRDSVHQGSLSSQTVIDVDETPTGSSSRRHAEPKCPKCPFRGHGVQYDRHMRGHENEFDTKCQVSGCCWTTEFKASMASHTRMHQTAAAAASEPSPEPVTPEYSGSSSSETSTDEDNAPAESSSKSGRARCLRCPSSGRGSGYDRHMRGHDNEFVCQVAGCGWTTERQVGMSLHMRMHKAATAAPALGVTESDTTVSPRPRPRLYSTGTTSHNAELQPLVPPPLAGPPPANSDVPSVADYSCLASTWTQYEEVGYMHVETSVKEGWTKEKLIPLSEVKGRSLDISRLKWTSGLKTIPIWQLKDSDEFLGGVPFNERTAGELRFAVQDCGAMRIDPPGVHDGSWFEQYVRPGMSDGQFLRTRPHMAGLNSYMYEPTLNGHYIRRAIEQDAKLKKNKTIQQIIETAYKKQLSIPLLLRKQIHDVNFWSTSGDVLFFSAHPNAYYDQIDDPFILSSLKDRNDFMRHRFPHCSKYGLLSSYPINIHTFGGRFEEIMLNWIAGPGLTIEWLYVSTGGTGTPFHHEPGGLASVNQNLGIIPPEGAVQTHPSSKIWTINYPAAYADFTHVMTSTGGEGDEYKLAYLNRAGGISRGLMNAAFPADNRPCTTTEQPVGSFVYVAPGVLHQVDNTGPTMSVARNIIDQLWIESGHIFINQILGSNAKNPGGILGCCYREAEEQAIRDNYKLRLDLQNRPEEFTTYMTVRTLMRCRTQDEKIAAKMDFELLKYMGGDWIEADKTVLGLDSVVSQGEVCVLENGGGAFPVPPNHIIYKELTRKKYYPTDHRH